MNLDKLKRTSLAKYKPYTYGEQPDTTDWIKLNTNENPYEPVKEVLEEIKASIDGNRMRLYPDPTCKKLRELIVSNLLNKVVKKENIIVANGSDEVLDILFKTYVDPEDNVVVFKPSYGMYPVLAELYGANIQVLKLTENYDLPESVFKVKGKLMFICSPNNPTGNAIDNDKLSKICQSFNGLVVIDEAYTDFWNGSALEIIKNYDNLVIMRTFSKAYCLASERIGFLIGNEKIIEDMMGIKLPYNVTYLSQIAAIATMNNIEIYKNRIKLIIEQRERFMKFLKEFKELYVYNSQSNFIFVKFPNKDVAIKIYDELRKKKILVRQYNKEDLISFLRFTIGSPEEMDKLIKEFRVLSTNIVKIN